MFSIKKKFLCSSPFHSWAFSTCSLHFNLLVLVMRLLMIFVAAHVDVGKCSPCKLNFCPLQVSELKGSTVLRHDLFTNDVLYAEVAFDMRTVKAELLPLVPLFW